MFRPVATATHFVVAEEAPEGPLVVLLEAVPHPATEEEAEDAPGCDAEGLGDCSGGLWQPLDQDGGPGAVCGEHVRMGAPGEVLPLSALPPNAHTHL